MNRCFKSWYHFMKSGQYKKEEEKDSQTDGNDYYQGHPTNEFQRGYDQAWHDDITEQYLLKHKLMMKIFNYYRNKRYQRSAEYNRGYDEFLNRNNG
ncbi:hypothetical protein [Lactobacillus sp. Sy-1]|uniref:hypothetical protein n=1 Tax=Lactobacillus sp. Sy-1 TaxID=2109645 RepID=UPI001C5BE7B1|nr:hypothetical protein [Lactobacillus sp. Sy-1]MBW1606149.1 hypothetical protein [Lactobacillus sp. Sy-1]